MASYFGNTERWKVEKAAALVGNGSGLYARPMLPVSVSRAASPSPSETAVGPCPGILDNTEPQESLFKATENTLDIC